MSGLMAIWMMGAALADTPVVLPLPTGPGPWMRGDAEFCTQFRSKGRSFGDVSKPMDDGIVLSCTRPAKNVDEVCLTVEDVTAWPKKWPTELTCTLGSTFYSVSVIEAYAPMRAFGETLWIKRPRNTGMAYTWTLPEGPLSEDAQAVRADGRPWDGVTCSAKGEWLSVSVAASASVDEGRCQFRTISVPLRIEDAIQ
jgi:hypothetical protein